MGTLTKEIADESNPPEVRMIGALLFKNFIINRGAVSIFRQNLTEFLGCKILRLLDQFGLSLQVLD